MEPLTAHRRCAVGSPWRSCSLFNCSPARRASYDDRRRRALTTWLERPRIGTNFGRHTAMLFAAAAAAAHSRVPNSATVEYLLRTTRSDSIPAEQVFHWSLMPSSLLGLLTPNVEPAVDPFIRHLYLGLVPFVCDRRPRESPCWPWRRSSPADSRSRSNHSPVLPFLHDLLPAISRVSLSGEIHFLVHLGMAILAATEPTGAAGGAGARCLAFLGLSSVLPSWRG